MGGIVVGSTQLESHQAGRAFGGGGRGRWRLRETGSRTHNGGYFPERGSGLSVWPGLLLLLLLLLLSSRCGFGWIEEEGRGWKEEAGRGERIGQRGARVPPNFIPRKCDRSRRISNGRPQIVGPLGRTGLVSFLLYLILFLLFFFLLHHCEVAHTNNYLIYTNSFSICNRLYISCLVEISKNLKLFFTIFYTLNEFLYGYRN
jgi:hypothetical protein